MRALDLFRGAGGWSVGAKRLGIEDQGVENMKEANATATAAGHATIGLDVWNFDRDAFDPELEIASPPCQTFSAAGKGRGREALDTVLEAIGSGRWESRNDLRRLAEETEDRTALVLMPLHLWGYYLPEFVAFEQVPTVLPVWEACAEVMREQGYSAWTGVLHAEQYGVPQTRKRAFLLARKHGEAAPPEPTHSRYYSRDPKRLDEGVKPWISMAEALGWDEREMVGFPRLADHQESVELDGVQYRARDLREASDPSFVVTEKARSWKRFRPAWPYSRPSTTIVGTFKPEVVAAPGYRTTVSRQNAPDSVTVSIQEAGVLQSFPRDYPWQGSKSKQFLQAGNAVPPLLAEAVLSTFKEAA